MPIGIACAIARVSRPDSPRPKTVSDVASAPPEPRAAARPREPAPRAAEPKPPVETARVETVRAETARVETARVEIARLETLDLGAVPDEAPNAIHDLAALAHDAGRGERDDAARTLTRWLREETRRDTPDARGNVPNLIEALGALGGDIAVDTLVDALADERHDLALKTLAVQQLGALAEAHGDARALRAIDRFTLVAENTAVRDDLDAELRAEAISAAEESGRRLHR